MAATRGAGDHTAGVRIDGPDKDGLWYVSDVKRGQWDTDERNRIIRQTAEEDGRAVRVIGPQDPGAAGVEAAKAFVRLLTGFAATVERETGPKEVRADPFSAQVNAGNVRLVRGPWNRAFVDELRQFMPGVDNAADDQVDAAAGAFNALAGSRRWGAV
jgi:predicted phage terminase large subunit-like protein